VLLNMTPQQTTDTPRTHLEPGPLGR